MSVAYVGEAIPFTAGFKNGGLGATGLTVTVDVRNHAGTEVVTGAAATDGGDGLYTYDLAANLNTGAGRYTAIFKTAGTADEQHQFSHFIVRAVTSALPDGALTTAKFADGALTAAKLADGAIAAAKIADDAITAAKIATGAIDADALATDAGTEIATAILDASNGVESGLTLRQWARAVLGAVLNITDFDSNTGVLTIKRRDGSTTAWSVTVNSTTKERTASTPGTLS